ncbi:MAG: hypothetical protein JSS65_04325 [Armatimonadetes bacterium]|nr:hypothetical protein [Armatimonadota bacterium]
MLSLILFTLATCLFGWPMGWVVAGVMFYGVLFVLFDKELKANRIVRVALAAAGVLMAWSYLSIFSERRDDLTITDSSVSYQMIDEVRTVPRTGLKVSYITKEPEYGWGMSRTWIVRDANGDGPWVSSYQTFWGPNGLTRSDEVGKRLAEWANVQPVDDTVRIRGVRH